MLLSDPLQATQGFNRRALFIHPQVMWKETGQMEWNIGIQRSEPLRHRVDVYIVIVFPVNDQGRDLHMRMTDTQGNGPFDTVQIALKFTIELGSEAFKVDVVGVDER